jgi:SMC interacting uncharacterized protein involved in chromosome segregation
MSAPYKLNKGLSYLLLTKNALFDTIVLETKMQTNSVSTHAIGRTQNRLNGLVTDEMVQRAAQFASSHNPNQKYYLVLRKFDRPISIPTLDQPGDEIMAVIKHGIVATIMLAKSWRATSYFSDGIIIQ